MTTIATQCMTEREARKLTEHIRVTAHNYTEAKEKLLALVQEAKDGGAHEALGYKSWTAYLAEVLGDEPLRLARDDRQEMVKVLSAEGMSRPAIAGIVGASEKTIQRDFREVGTNVPTSVTGIDGKTYARPEPVPEPTEPPKPKRPPLPEQFFNATYDLGKNVERLKRLIEDDRFPQNREKVAAKHRNDLQRTADVLADILRSIN